jgi:tetratricopeptide (TPR) repeat protein
VLPALARLADASLLVAEPAPEGTRYRLLMTVRTFGRERLSEAAEAADAARRHRDHYLALAAELDANMVEAGLAIWLPRGRREHENLQAALHWSLERGDSEAAFALAARLGMYWFRAGFIKDGRELLERAMRDADPAGPEWPRALVGRAMLAGAAGAPDALEAAGEAVAACEAAGETYLLLLALAWRSDALIRAGSLAEARRLLGRTRALALSIGSDEGVAFSDQLLGDLLHRAGDLDGAGELLVRARDRFRRFRAPLDAGFTLVDLARVRLTQGRAAEALEVAGEALTDFRRREDPRGVASAFACLGRAYAQLGESERARPPLEEALALSGRWGFTLPESRQVHEALQELAFGPGVESLAVARARADPRSVMEERNLDVGAPEELR